MSLLYMMVAFLEVSFPALSLLRENSVLWSQAHLRMKDPYMAGDGINSFSYFFWDRIFWADSFYDSFLWAKKGVGINQNPLLDGNGDGIGNDKEDDLLASQLKIGNEDPSLSDAPSIGQVCIGQQADFSEECTPLRLYGTFASIVADPVIDVDPIERVWAIIIPPGYSTEGADGPITDLPSVDLYSVGNDRYEGYYADFTVAGKVQNRSLCP